MPVYRYSAIDVHGAVQAGTMQAGTPAEARQRLRDRKWRIERFQADLASSEAHRLHVLEEIRRRIVARKAKSCVADFARHVALLLRTGVPLAEALEVLIAQERYRGSSRRWVLVLQALRDRVGSGKSLGAAMQEHPTWFGPMIVGAVQVGQESGNLDDALDGIAAYLRRHETLANRITTAMVYPSILTVVGLAVMIFLMTYVIPQLFTVLEAGGRTLPASTRVLKRISDLLTQHWLVLALACLVILGAGRALLRHPRGEHYWHRVQLRIPLIGPLLRKTLIARFAHQAATLLATGVPFPDAMRTVRQSTKHRILADALDGVERAVAAGSDIAPALQASGIFPPMVVHLVGVGQSTGELTEMLTQLSVGYEHEVDLAVGRFSAALEPTLIVLLSGAVGFVIYATMMPILEATRVMR